jgi:hypothetical protein
VFLSYFLLGGIAGNKNAALVGRYRLQSNEQEKFEHFEVFFLSGHRASIFSSQKFSN